MYGVGRDSWFTEVAVHSLLAHSAITNPNDQGTKLCVLVKVNKNMRLKYKCVTMIDLFFSTFLLHFFFSCYFVGGYLNAFK